MHRILRNSPCIWLIAILATAAQAQEGPKAEQPDTTTAPAATAAAEPAAEEPAADVATAANPSAAKTDDAKLTFNFRYQPWQDVLDWFADQAGLSLLIESPPPGTFNYRDTRSYTPREALDVLNSVLLTKGYTLVRRDRMLVLVNLEDGVPPNLVPDVPLEELDERGEYELIRVLFPVWNMAPEQAAEEIQPILGPQGKVVTLPQARQIQVTETAGRLRTIRSIVNAVEQPELGTAGVREFTLNYVTFEAAMPTIRNILGIPAEAYSTPDGAVQITKSAVGEKILFRGTAQHAARLQEILRLIDVPDAAPGINGAPQLEVYPVTTADPEAVLKVLEHLMRGDPNVTLATDKEAGHIVAFAAPPQQATIRATIDQMQKESREVDVIALTNTDPQVAVLAINKLFGSMDDKPDPKAPRVDADLSSRSLLVRGTTSQVQQIRDLLRQLGETEDGTAARDSSQQHVRLLPLTGGAARSAIEQIEQIWPTVRPNRIRVLTPSAAIPAYRPGESSDKQSPKDQEAPFTTPSEDTTGALQRLDSLRDDAAKPGATARDAVRNAADARTGVFRYAADQIQAELAKPNVAPETATTGPPSPTPAAKPSNPNKGAPVVIAPGPGGLLIASDDLEALDELEDMLTAIAGRGATSEREYSVFYLKYAKAATIAEVLASIFGGSTGNNDRGLIGDMASNALGDVGGALMGDLLLGGGGGSSFSSASVEIVPDARLNAIIVHAKPADRDTIYQLLQVLDQRTGPEEVEADGQPRSIPVYNASASDIAQTIQQLYQDRIAGGSGAMSPQEMMKMLRGGPNTEQQVQKMSIAVDTRNNMLIVRASDPLFEEIKMLVAELDEMEADSPETTRVVSLKHTNSSAVQKALTSILDNVTTSTTTAQGSTPSPSNSNDGDEDSPEERARRAMRRNWEMMQEMRRIQERLGGDRGGGGGFDRSRFFGGRGGPGGGDGDRGGEGDRGRGGNDGERRGRD